MTALGPERIAFDQVHLIKGDTLYALGSLAMVLLTTFPPLPMPRRYVDYPEWGRITNQVSILASVLTFPGAAGMVVTLAVAGTQSLLRLKR